jgi:endoglucanase
MMNSRSLPVWCLLVLCSLASVTAALGQKLQVNEKEYFETAGLNVLVFSNQYNGFFYDEKTAGIELIHHGVRTSTGGAVRLQPTPEQWDLIPIVTDRKVDRKNGSIEVTLRYDAFHFDSRVRVTAKDGGVNISVLLDKPLPDTLIGRAGFNLEFLPSAYFEKTFLADGKPGIFPLYPAGQTKMRPLSEKIPQYAGHTTFDDRGRGEYIMPDPIASGKSLVLAPEDPQRRVMIRALMGDLALYDGRNLAQNGWFVVRSLIPGKATGKVVEWYLEPNAIPHWIRKPVIGFSQAGYHPLQRKVAVIELDNHDTPLATAALCQVTPDGKFVERLKGQVKSWGNYQRYNYVTFDFSAIRDSGLYVIAYGDQQTEAFPIGSNVYNDIWHPTMDVWFPVQMDHMMVNEAYRVWHGVPYLDDALQAPVNLQHFDGYFMGPTTGTKYKPLERIPGLAVGGWFDAGDFDIQTGSHCAVLLSFVDTWEQFHPTRDETFIDQKTRYVDIHRPDGKPDILQQIEHGTLQVVAQLKNIGFPVRGIVVPNLHQYQHLGDASTITDNLPYNPALKPYESDGKSSGTMDDRWVFTTRSPWMDYSAIAALAAASRPLKDFNTPLADECLVLAKRLWDEDKNQINTIDTTMEAMFFGNTTRMTAALQLYITTRDPEYARQFNDLIWPALDSMLPLNIAPAVQAYPYMDAPYKTKLRGYVENYKQFLEMLAKDNPYGVPSFPMAWGSNNFIVTWAIGNYHAHKAFPDIVGPEYVYAGLDYLFGCHPYSNVSFVSSVGTHSKKITYGNNRADFRFIAGGVVPGILSLKPDFPENKEDWPFLWGENECVIDIGAQYVYLSHAVQDLLTREEKTE